MLAGPAATTMAGDRPAVSQPSPAWRREAGSAKLHRCDGPSPVRDGSSRFAPTHGFPRLPFAANVPGNHGGDDMGGGGFEPRYDLNPRYTRVAVGRPDVDVGAD